MSSRYDEDDDDGEYGDYGQRHRGFDWGQIGRDEDGELIDGRERRFNDGSAPSGSPVITSPPATPMKVYFYKAQSNDTLMKVWIDRIDMSSKVADLNMATDYVDAIDEKYGSRCNTSLSVVGPHIVAVIDANNADTVRSVMIDLITKYTDLGYQAMPLYETSRLSAEIALRNAVDSNDNVAAKQLAEYIRRGYESGKYAKERKGPLLARGVSAKAQPSPNSPQAGGAAAPASGGKRVLTDKDKEAMRLGRKKARAKRKRAEKKAAEKPAKKKPAKKAKKVGSKSGSKPKARKAKNEASKPRRSKAQRDALKKMHAGRDKANKAKKAKASKKAAPKRKKPSKAKAKPKAKPRKKAKRKNPGWY